MNQSKPNTASILATVAALTVTSASADDGLSIHMNVNLSVPATDADGSFIVTWNNSADPYLDEIQRLQRKYESGPYVTVYEGFGGSHAASGLATGTWTYRIEHETCFGFFCSSDYSAPKSVSVGSGGSGGGSGNSLAVPQLEAAPYVVIDQQVIAWQEIPGATSYQLERKIGGGLWAMAYSGSDLQTWLSVPQDIVVHYRVKACDSSNCSNFSDSVSTVTQPPNYRLRTGHINGDTKLDYAVVAVDQNLAPIEEFILQSDHNGNLSVMASATQTQLTQARGWQLTNANVVIGDANMDGNLDVGISGNSGIGDYIVWGSASGGAPSGLTKVDDHQRAFLRENAKALTDSTYYENALKIVTAVSSGWRTSYAFITSPGYYYDQFWQLRYFGIGPAWINAYITQGQSYTILDPDVVLSPASYFFMRQLEDFDSVGLGGVSAQAETVIVILRDLFGSNMDLEGIVDSVPGEDGSDRAIGAASWAQYLLCEILSAGCEQIMGEDATHEMVQCGPIIKAGVIPENVPIVPPGVTLYGFGLKPVRTVSHSPGQEFRLTASQDQYAEGSTDAERLSFWQSRENDSRDPLAPLAIMVVNNEWFYGCVANVRYLLKAEEFGVTESLTDAGFLVIGGHSAETLEDYTTSSYVRGKLGPRQVADYHFRVFQAMGLPANTFGGARTGLRDEALIFGKLWCPSCDQDE